MVTMDVNKMGPRSPMNGLKPHSSNPDEDPGFPKRERVALAPMAKITPLGSANEILCKFLESESESLSISVIELQSCVANTRIVLLPQGKD